MSSTEGESRIDPAAIDRIYKEHGNALRGFLRGLLRDDELAAEALQNTFGKAISRGGSVVPAALRSWLFRVAYNEAMAIRRRQRVESDSLRKLAWSSARHQETPEEAALSAESKRRVRREIRRLPDEQQEVLRRRIYDEMTFVQIAEILDLPLGTVLTRMRLALQKIRKALAE